MLAGVFPGQGAQTVGMLGDLAAEFDCVEAAFSEASAVVGYDLWGLVQSGPAEKLAQTEFTQPALLAASVAVWRAWRAAAGPEPALLAGHSLGEYSALVCAEAIDFADAVGLVQQRGRLMQSAVPAGEGTMAAILGLDDDVVSQCCDKADGTVTAANFNAPGQVVIAGHVGAVNDALERCKAAGARRAMPLDVSAPFHTPLMATIKAPFQEALDRIEVRLPRIPVINNVGVSASDSVDVLRARLVDQLSAPVPWVACANKMIELGATQFVECGPGSVLGGLIKRISRSTPTLPLGTQDGFNSSLETLT